MKLVLCVEGTNHSILKGKLYLATDNKAEPEEFYDILNVTNGIGWYKRRFKVIVDNKVTRILYG